MSKIQIDFCSFVLICLRLFRILIILSDFFQLECCYEHKLLLYNHICSLKNVKLRIFTLLKSLDSLTFHFKNAFLFRRRFTTNSARGKTSKNRQRTQKRTYTDSQKHESTFFDSRPFMCNKLFLKNSYRSW